METTNAVKTCQKCAKEMPVNRFTCPHCATPQTAGVWDFKSQQATRVVPEDKPAALIPPVRSLFVGGPFSAAVVEFSRTAKILVPLTPVENISPITLEIHSGTNGVAALEAAEEALFLNGVPRYARTVIAFLTDGDFNCTNGLAGLFGINAKQKAIETAERIKSQYKTQIATILFDKGDHDEDTLRKMASKHCLFIKAGEGQLMRALLSITRVATQTAQTISDASVLPGTAIVFCLDCSPSMEQNGKKEEAEQAFIRCILELKTAR